METSFWQTLKETQPEFLKHVDSDFFCTICSTILIDPYATPCSHNFCLPCLSKILESEKKTCPLDNESFSGLSPLINRYLQKKVLEVSFKCPNILNGCKWEGTTAELSDHLKECSEEAVVCRFGCGNKSKGKNSMIT